MYKGLVLTMRSENGSVASVSLRRVTEETRAEVLRRTRDRCASGEARTLRLDAQLSLQELASECLVAKSTLFRWEVGERVPRGPAALVYGSVLDRLAD